MNLNVKKFMYEYTDNWNNGNPLSPKELRRLLLRCKSEVFER